MRKSVFRQVRFSLYAAILVNGMIQLVVPFLYKCNVTGKTCFACGLRTAVYFFLQGKFKEAYQSNKLIIVLIIVFLIIVTDVGHYCRKNLHSKQPQS